MSEELIQRDLINAPEKMGAWNFYNLGSTTLKSLKGAKIYIVTDGKKTFWINPLTGNDIQFEDGNVVSLQFNKDDVECIKLIDKAIASISVDNDIIIESTVVDPLPLAQRVWQDLWAVSGATPENCLYTFVEVFIFKYLSDLGVLTGFHSFNHLLRQYDTNSDNEVIEYYASTVRVKIKNCFQETPRTKLPLSMEQYLYRKMTVPCLGMRQYLEKY